METTEIANAFLSRAANTTKYMTAAQRKDSITDLALTYNRDKNTRMPYLLADKLKAISAKIPELSAQLSALLGQHASSLEDVDDMVRELRQLAAMLNSREDVSAGQLEDSIEAISDSVRSHQTAVGAADSAKRRQRARRQLSADRTRLKKLLTRYHARTGVVLEQTNIEDGQFPWHDGSLARGSVDLSGKRAICEVYMRLNRAREEEEMVKGEMRRLLSHGEDTLTHLGQTLDVSTKRTFFQIHVHSCSVQMRITICFTAWVVIYYVKHIKSADPLR